MLSSLFFFFKQKTAYEMRISDWSSDVCSSDLMMDIGAARLDRDRHAVALPERDRGGAVGKEEFGIDHVEGKAFAQRIDHRHQRADQRRDMTPPPRPRPIGRAHV